MKRAGFTMIELIFVIVILGILAAVAIPKLAATRTDAGVSKVTSNLQTAIKDLGAYALSNGTLVAADTWGDVTSVPLFTDTAGTTAATATVLTTAVYLHDGSGAATGACFSLDVTDLVDANITAISLAGGTSGVCVGSQALALKNLQSATGTGVTHTFAQTGVTY